MAVESETQMQTAREAVRSLFAVMNIKRVIVVDDVLSSPFSSADVIGQCVAFLNGGKTAVLKSVSELAQIDFDISDADVVTSSLRVAIESMDDSVRRSIAVTLADAKDGRDDAENASRTQLEGILQDYVVRCLTLGQWNDEKGALLSDPAAAETLFLFDQDMSQADGTDVEGIRIIAGLLNEEPKRAMYCALISHTVPAGHEYEAINVLAKEHGIEGSKDRLVVISKAHLRDDPMAFAFRLKRAAVAPHCGALKGMVLNVVQEAIEHARKELESLNVYDFEQIVFQSSFLEGVWEPDTLIRLFNLFHRREARARAMQHTGIRTTADAVRQVISIPFKPTDAPKSSSNAIRRIELFEDATYLSTHHLPIELGDVFQKGTSRKNIFILVGPPCDLMVRSDGRRCGCKEAVLAQLFDSKSDAQGMWFELPVFCPETYSSSWVRFRETLAIPLRILDLTVFDNDGESKILFDEPVTSGLVPSWTKRHGVLASEFQKMSERYRVVSSGIDGSQKGEALKCVQQSITGSNGFIAGVVDLDKKEIKYNLKRIGRLKEPLAGALLRAYSAYVSRDAFDHDFTSAVHEEVGQEEEVAETSCDLAN